MVVVEQRRSGAVGAERLGGESDVAVLANERANSDRRRGVDVEFVDDVRAAAVGVGFKPAEGLRAPGVDVA